VHDSCACIKNEQIVLIPFLQRSDNILEQAVRAFTAATGGTVKVLGREIPGPDGTIDARVAISFRQGSVIFDVELKGEVRMGIRQHLLERFGVWKEPWLLIAQYIPGPLKVQLRDEGINYMEATGNCYLNTGNIFIFINDKEVTPLRLRQEGKLWKPSGLRLLFALLQEPSLATATYRDLANKAGIAMGSISPLLTELRQEGGLDQRERLFTRWAEAYTAVLQPKLGLGRFRFVGQDTNEWPRQLPGGTFWSGEPAGELYTHQLVAEEFILYTDRRPAELVPVLRIVPDEEGNLRLYKKFWQHGAGDKGVASAVPPLLAYADLRSSDSSRNWEIAERIKTRYVND
jgi:hypothetical protein